MHQAGESPATLPESPGARGGHRTGPEADARANAAEPEGSAPAARDGGGAAAAGIAAGTGAAGSAHPNPIAEALAAPAPPDYVPLGMLRAKRGPVVDEVLSPPPLVVDASELPEQAATVRAEIERQLGWKLIPTSAENFAGQVARLERVREGEAFRVCVEAAAEYQRRTGERPASLTWFVGAMARFLGEPELGKPPALPGPDEGWLASLGNRRAKAEAQWALVLERVTGPRSGVWPDRQRAVLEQELQGLLRRFEAGGEPPLSAAGGAS